MSEASARYIDIRPNTNLKQSIQIKESIQNNPDTTVTTIQEINFADSLIRNPVPSVNYEEIPASTNEENEIIVKQPTRLNSIKFKSEPTTAKIDEIVIEKDSSTLIEDTTTISFFNLKEQKQVVVQTQPPNNNSSKEKQPDIKNQDWITGILLLTLLLLVWLRFKHKTYLKHVVNAFFNNRFVRQMLRETQPLTRQASIIFSTVFLLSSSLFIVQLLNSAWVINKLDEYGKLNISPDYSLIFFFKTFAALVIFFAAKLLLLKISGHIFKIHNTISEYVFNVFLFNKIAGIVLFILVVLIAFFSLLPDDVLIVSGLSLGIIFFFIRLSKMLYLGNIIAKYSTVYIILYLCTLEILPFVVVLKVLVISN